jgi:hypothetical protein
VNLNNSHPYYRDRYYSRPSENEYRPKTVYPGK